MVVNPPNQTTTDQNRANSAANQLRLRSNQLADVIAEGQYEQAPQRINEVETYLNQLRPIINRLTGTANTWTASSPQTTGSGGDWFFWVLLGAVLGAGAVIYFGQ